MCHLKVRLDFEKNHTSYSKAILFIEYNINLKNDL